MGGEDRCANHVDCSRSRRPDARVAAAGLIALAVARGIGRFAFTPILPMMRADAGVSVALGGWLAAANYIGYLAGALSAMWLRLSAAATIRVSLLVIGLATLAMGVTHDVAAWIVLRAVAGVASAWVLIHASAWSTERLRRPTLGGVVFAGVGIGIALAGVTCLALMRIDARSALAWNVLGIVALVLGAVTWPMFAEREGVVSAARVASHVPAAPATASDARTAPDTVRLVLCYGAFGFGYIIPATFLPVMARELIEDPAVFGWVWPIFGIAAAVSPIVAARWSGTHIRRVWIVAHLVMAVGVALPIVSRGLPGIALAACDVGGTFMVITMAGMQEARRVAGPSAPRLMAAITAAFATGQIVGPLCVSGLAGFGVGFAPALAVAALALGGAPSRWLEGRLRRRDDQSRMAITRAGADSVFHFTGSATIFTFEGIWSRLMRFSI